MPTYSVHHVAADKTEKLLGTFTSPADASAAAKTYTQEFGGKCRIDFDHTWKEYSIAVSREESRMCADETADKAYRPVPHFFPVWDTTHYVHFALDEKRRAQGWIAYTPDKRHLIEDRQLTLPASKYLSKFFPHMSGDEISDLQNKLIASLEPTQFFIVKDRAKLREAYIDQPHCAESSDYESCMRYPGDEYGLPKEEHPCDAYLFDDPEASDFALAYTTRGSQIVARAMVLPKNKIFVRVYGLGESDKFDIIEHLKAAGYKRAKSFEGARLAMRAHPVKKNAIVIPYLDGEAKWVSPDGVIHRHAGKDFYCGETAEGYAYAGDDEDEDYEPDMQTCYVTGEAFDANRETWEWVYIPHDSTYRTGSIEPFLVRNAGNRIQWRQTNRGCCGAHDNVDTHDPRWQEFLLNQAGVENEAA